MYVCVRIVLLLSMVLAVSGPVLRLKPSQRMIFFENVPGLTVGGGDFSFNNVIV